MRKIRLAFLFLGLLACLSVSGCNLQTPETPPAPTPRPGDFVASHTEPGGLILWEYGAFVTVYGYNGTGSSVVIPDNFMGKPITRIDQLAFAFQQNLTAITFPSGLTSIGDSAFLDCTGLTGSLTFPPGLTSIGDYAFSQCTGFTGSLTFPPGLTSIGDYAFSQCTGFTGSLTFPPALSSIGNYAFQFCSGFKGSLTFSPDLASIEDHAFYYCTGFTGSLTLPSELLVIGDSAFQHCSGFNGTLTFPSDLNLESIGDWVFSSTGFKGELTLPPSLLFIGSCTFCDCPGFTSLTLPPELLSMGNNTFYDCSSLVLAKSPRSYPPVCGSNVFKNTAAAFKIKVPSSSVAAYKAANGWSAYAGKILALP
jgi:hypothetical protein